MDLLLSYENPGFTAKGFIANYGSCFTTRHEPTTSYELLILPIQNTCGVFFFITTLTNHHLTPKLGNQILT